jgi:PmbA protein
VGRTAAEGQTSDVDDRRYSALSREDRLDVLVTAERVTRAVDRDLELSAFSYRDERVVRTLVNTRGLRLREASTVFRVEGVVRDAGLGISLSDVIEDRAFATVASLPFGATLARRLVELRGTRTTWDGPARVMLPPRVVAELFGLLAPHFRLRELQSDSSFLSRARSGGNLVLSPRLHVVDDGLLSGALNSRSFDDHGVSPVPLTLLRDGQVDGWYMDLDEARARDVRPTGHVRDGRLMPSNLVVRGGSRSMNALLAEQPQPVVVLDHVRGLDRGLDLQTGRLSCKASGRVVVPRNDTRGWLPEMKLQGDLTEVLTRIVDLASDTDRHGHIDAPGMLVDGLSVS